MSNKEIRAKIKNRSSGNRESNIERLDINLVQKAQEQSVVYDW